MPYFKDTKNKIYFLDDASFVKLLPIDCIEISEGAAVQLLAPQAAQLAEKEANKVKSDLLVIDINSIRAIREYIASKADAPKIIKDRETLAAQLRVKLK